MALTSPALTLAIEALWANIKPTMDALQPAERAAYFKAHADEIG